jgi:hypothetical protein
MKKLLIILFSFMFLTACNKQESSNQENNKQSKKETKEMTPDTWAEEVNSIYDKSITKLDETIGSKPPLTEELKKKVEEIKNSIILELLEYGKARNKMNETDQKLCSSKLSLKLDRIVKNPGWDRSINKVRMDYDKADQAFGKQIMSFNIITQYAQFELLKKQEPSEAKRLGIE